MFSSRSPSDLQMNFRYSWPLLIVFEGKLDKDPFRNLYIARPSPSFPSLAVHHLIFQLENILMTITLNQTTKGQTLWRGVHLETDISTCSHIAFSDACKSYLFLCNTSKKVTVMWLRCMAIASSQAGQVYHFLQTKHTHNIMHNYATHRDSC